MMSLRNSLFHVKMNMLIRVVECLYQTCKPTEKPIKRNL